MQLGWLDEAKANFEDTVSSVQGFLLYLPLSGGLGVLCICCMSPVGIVRDEVGE